MDITDQQFTQENLTDNLPQNLLPLLDPDQRDSAKQFIQKLPQTFLPENIIHIPSSIKPKDLRLWELIGLRFMQQRRFYEGLSIFSSLYNQLLIAEKKISSRGHKGMPLIWIYECYKGMGFPVHAKRYLMLTVIEDAITDQGNISYEGGVYFRSVWLHGISDSELMRYSKKVYELSSDNPLKYPEWFLQELDQDWMTEYPSPQEGLFYQANTLYIRQLLEELGDGTGRSLETLAGYILSCMPGCRTTRRQRTYSTDYDIVCSMEGFEIDFRSEFGRYFVCECKDWSRKADFTTMAKFCRVLDSTKSRFGILFSKNGLSGVGDTRNAEREQLKVFQDRGMVIVVIDQNDLEFIAEGGNFTNLLRSKYEKVRLDLLKNSN